MSWKDYTNGRKFSIKSLGENLILIGLFICYFKKRNEHENILSNVNEFIKINSLLSGEYFKNQSDINRYNFKNIAQIIRICEDYNIGDDVIDRFKSELINSLNTKCESYHDLKYTINELPKEIYLEFLNLFPKFSDGKIPKLILYGEMTSLIRDVDDLKNILKNDEIKFSHGYIEYLKENEFERIISFYNKRSGSTASDLKDILSNSDFNKLKKSLEKHKSFDIKYFLNSFTDKPIRLMEEHRTFKEL